MCARAAGEARAAVDAHMRPTLLSLPSEMLPIISKYAMCAADSLIGQSGILLALSCRAFRDVVCGLSEEFVTSKHTGTYNGTGAIHDEGIKHAKRDASGCSLWITHTPPVLEAEPYCLQPKCTLSMGIGRSCRDPTDGLVAMCFDVPVQTRDLLKLLHKPPGWQDAARFAAHQIDHPSDEYPPYSLTFSVKHALGTGGVAPKIDQPVQFTRNSASLHGGFRDWGCDSERLPYPDLIHDFTPDMLSSAHVAIACQLRREVYNRGTTEAEMRFFFDPCIEFSLIGVLTPDLCSHPNFIEVIDELALSEERHASTEPFNPENMRLTWRMDPDVRKLAGSTAGAD